MEKAAKLFTNGRSQAVRIPAEFKINADRVFIRQESNGDLVISRHSVEGGRWDSFFSALNGTNVTDDFLDVSDRNDCPAMRDPFKDVH